jgi:hypothetical protein
VNREQPVNQDNRYQEVTTRNNERYIRLDIKVDALQRLINNNDITIDQIHCIGSRSKATIKAAMLNSIKCTNKLNATKYPI